MQALNAHPAMKIEVYTHFIHFITETLFYNILFYLLQELRGKLTSKSTSKSLNLKKKNKNNLWPQYLSQICRA